MPIQEHNSWNHDNVAYRGEMEEFLAAQERVEVKARTLLLGEGEVADTLFIVNKGALRLFFNDDGRDVTFQFFMEGDMVASFDSLYNRLPSLFSLESIEPSSLIAVSREELFRFIHSNDQARDMFERILAERFHAYQQLFLSRIRNSPAMTSNNVARHICRAHAHQRPRRHHPVDYPSRPFPSRGNPRQNWIPDAAPRHRPYHQTPQILLRSPQKQNHDTL